MVRLNPEPHRRVFLKPFMRDQVPEFCSGCHKVHLDVPVNNYRWVRGFNEYDNWQGSGVSGQGARSFYYPAESHDLLGLPHAAGAFERRGQYQRLRPLASLPGGEHCGSFRQRRRHANEASKKFLQDQAIVRGYFRDFASWKESQPNTKATGYPKQELSTTFAVGEEAESLCRRDLPVKRAQSPLRSGA